MAPIRTASLLRFLGRPETYCGQTRAVQVIETHFAWVFLTDHYAYKLKKPLHQDVMDYRSIASRARGCRNELRLNRRLAPEVYLEVVRVGRRRDGTLLLGAGGETADWLVKMRRLSASAMMDRRIEAGAFTSRDRKVLVELLARFYRQARSERMRPDRYIRLLCGRIDENQHELCAPEFRLDAAAIAEVAQTQRGFVDSNLQLLRSRAARLVDAHGDLRPEHIHLGRGAQASCVIDCLEFDAALRRLDPLEELAFLALECRRIGAESLGASIARGVQVAIIDTPPESLSQFYQSQRALTRAKLAAWHLCDPSPAGRKHWVMRATSYVRDALHFARLALRTDAVGRGGTHLPGGRDDRYLDTRRIP